MNIKKKSKEKLQNQENNFLEKISANKEKKELTDILLGLGENFWDTIKDLSNRDEIETYFKEKGLSQESIRNIKEEYIVFLRNAKNEKSTQKKTASSFKDILHLLTHIRPQGIKTINELIKWWVRKPSNIIALKDIITGATKKSVANLEFILKHYNTLDELIKLKEIILHGSAAILESLSKSNISTLEERLELQDIILHWDIDTLEMFLAHPTTKSTNALKTIKDIITSDNVVYDNFKDKIKYMLKQPDMTLDFIITIKDAIYDTKYNKSIIEGLRLSKIRDKETIQLLLKRMKNTEMRYINQYSLQKMLELTKDKDILIKYAFLKNNYDDTEKEKYINDIKNIEDMIYLAKTSGFSKDDIIKIIDASIYLEYIDIDIFKAFIEHTNKDIAELIHVIKEFEENIKGTYIQTKINTDNLRLMFSYNIPIENIQRLWNLSEIDKDKFEQLIKDGCIKYIIDGQIRIDSHNFLYEANKENLSLLSKSGIKYWELLSKKTDKDNYHNEYFLGNVLKLILKCLSYCYLL